MRRDLNKQQENFAVLVAGGETYTQAAITAGYSARTARVQGGQLRRLPHIDARIRELKSLATGEAVLSIRRRLVILSEIADNPQTTSKGSPIIGPRIQAISEINKMTGAYERQPQSEGDKTVNIYVTSEKAGDMLTRMGAGELRQGENDEPEEVAEVSEGEE